MGFRVGLIYTRWASMPQALWVGLREDGHDVVRPEDRGFTIPMSPDDMTRYAHLVDADVLICPMLKQVVPAEVCTRWPTWIPHPGIRGDRGPSSLSWAIVNGEPIWGLTLVKAEPSTAAEDLDSGNVGAWQEFAMPTGATMAEVYAQYIIPAAINCARHLLNQMATEPGYRGVPLAACQRSPAGRYRPPLRQADLAFGWDQPPGDILLRIRAAPFGVRTELAGQSVNVYDAHGPETTWFQPPPGEIIAHRDGAALVGTGEAGAVWIGHAKIKPDDGGPGLKLPTVHTLRTHLNGQAESLLHPDLPPSRSPTYQVIRYRRIDKVGWIHAEPYNGAASTTFCRRLLTALKYAAAQDTTAIAVAGGQVAWNNGIHLGIIEAAADPRAEAWANIQAIDDVAEFVFNLPQITIAVLNASAGAGGAVLSACFDCVLARRAVVLNYHYLTMGLSGSELRSLVLPRRAGSAAAERLLFSCLPTSAAEAHRLGLVDLIGPDDPVSFLWWAQEVAAELAGERRKTSAPVDSEPYRRRELTEMWRDIFEDRRDFEARRRRFLGVAARSAPILTS